MLRRNLWKLILSLAIMGWAVATLLPLNDRPFPEYIKSQATANKAEFNRLVDEAAAMAAA